MRKLYLISTLLLCSILYGTSSVAQDFSNKGKEFWLAYSYHVGMVNAGSAVTMTLYLTSDVATTYNVEIFGGVSISSGTIAANQVIPVIIPNTYFISSDGQTNGRTIHVTAAKPIVVYSFITRSQASAASLCLPANVLGKEYYSASFTQNSNENNASSYITIIAIEDNTNIEVTVTAPTVAGWAANSTHIVSLNKGQIYQVLGTTAGNTGVDLSGSKIKSIASSNGGCKRIAVFSGSGKISIGSPGCTGGSADNLYQQLYPVSSWGKKYLTVPSTGKPNNHYRIYRSDPLSNVYLNGVLIPAASFTNNYYQFFNNTPNLIESNIPVTVAQYFTSQGCPVGAAPSGNPSPYDPDMILLNPVEQNINKVTLVNSPLTITGAHQHNLHVVMPNSGTSQSSFRFDGNTVPSLLWVVHPQDPGYSYLYLANIASGNHTLSSDSGFNALAYGYGNAETYGYSAGANVKDLYQQIGVATDFGIEPSPSVCKGSPFKFKVSLPYCVTSMNWELTNLPGPPVAPPTQSYSTCSPGVGGPDSTTVVNGKTLYWYSLPNSYSFNTSGSFPVTITTTAPDIDGCGTIQEIDFDLNVYDPPVGDFTWPPIGCYIEPVQFNEAVTTSKPTYKWFWDFKDPASGINNNSILKNPVHTFSGPGTYIVELTAYNTVGCLVDKFSKTVIVPNLPTATLTGNTSVCINASPVPITFTATGGASPYTFSYTLDNGSGPIAQTPITTTIGNSITISVPTTTAGVFTYNLTNVKNQNSTLCTQAVTGQTATVTVSANTAINLTSAAATTSQTVCVNTAIADITYAIGGNGNATVTGLPSGVVFAFNAATGVVTISGSPTIISSTPQIITYTVNATGACLPSSVTGTITINPNASITLTSAAATTNQEVCKNAGITNIVYAIDGGGTGATATGLPTGVTLIFSGGTATIIGTPTQTGIFNYTINTTGTCAQTIATGKITVNELPTADFTIVPPGCENKLVTFNDASTPNTGTLNNWAWTFGDATTGTGATTTHIYSTAGIYNVGLTVTTDKGCVSNPAANKQLTISVNPKAGFMIPEVCLNDVAAIFTDTSKINPGTITSWSWNFGDGSPLTTTKDGSHKYLTTGTFQVTHTVTSSTGCLDVITQNITINGANPIADFSVANPATLCSNQLVSINDLSSVNPGSVTKLEIYWDNINAPAVFDLDDVPANKTYTHQYPVLVAAKNYTIRLRAYSGTICVNDKFTTITVNATPKIQFLNIPDVCMDAAPFQITQASETGGVAGTATFSGPGVSPTGLFSPAIAGFGTHTINYSFKSTAGGCIEQLSKTIHVFQPVTASFIASSACEGQDVTFTDNTTPTEGTLTKWTWDFGDGSAAVIKNSSAAFTHKFPTAGSFNVKLFVTTSNGCLSIPKIITVTVSPQPKVNFNIPATVCLPDANVTFNNLSSIADGTEGTFIYNWNFGDPSSASNTSTIKNAAHTYTTLGPFNVNLQITSAAGCIHDTTIVLNTIHPQPVADFTTDKSDVCIGGSFNFTDKSSPLDGTTTQWNWTLDDGNVKNTPTFTYTYSAVRVYNVGLFIFNSQGCRSNTKTIALGVNPYPTANAGPDKLVLEGGQVALTPAMTIGINVNYLWTPATGLNNPTAPSPLASPASDITYTLILTSDKGCVSNTDDVFVKVLKAPAIPNIFSPNGDGVHDRWDINYLNTYPGASIDIYNRYGQLVFHSIGYGTSWDGKANGKDVPVGTYYYVIDPKNGRQKYAGYVDVIR